MVGFLLVKKKIKPIPITRNKTNENLSYLNVLNRFLLLIPLLFHDSLEGMKENTHENRDIG